MSVARPVGGYFSLDAEGCLMNPCCKELLPAAWRPVLEAVVIIYREETGRKLYSVWLRGSLPRGLAVEGLSNLDTFALVPPDLYWCYRAFAKWYPEHDGDMYATLEYYLQPNPAGKERRLRVVRPGEWLYAETQLRQPAGD